MKMSMLKKAVVAAVGAMAFTSAHAQITWQLSPDANTLAFGQSVITGVNEINFLSNATQPQGIYGAGFQFTGSDFSMKFDSDLYTWDSYSPFIGGNTGYFDAFIVTVSTSGYYWNSSPVDPILASASTWVWGGATYGDALESYTCNVGCFDTISLAAGPAANYFVSIVLDTKTLPFSDVNYPSWGSFHVTPIPEPEIYAMMAAGLGLMGFIARRRKQHDDAVV